jgi:hypothetical protein
MSITEMRPRDIVKQKSVDSSTEAASVLKGGWSEPLPLTLHVSTRKKASLPVPLDVVLV